MAKQTAFDRRLARCGDELKWLYCELYHGDIEAYEAFLQMLRRSCAESMALSMGYPSIREMPPPEPLADMTGIPAMDSVLISR